MGGSYRSLILQTFNIIIFKTGAQKQNYGYEKNHFYGHNLVLSFLFHQSTNGPATKWW
jgi:hypothetical protein